MKKIKAADLTSAETVRELNAQFQILLDKEMNSKLDAFHVANQKPMFRFMTMYMNMILLLLSFLRATRDGRWELHLVSLEAFARIFFA